MQHNPTIQGKENRSVKKNCRFLLKKSANKRDQNQ